MSPYDPGEQEIGQHIVQHGDGVKDICMDVEDLDNIMEVSYSH